MFLLQLAQGPQKLGGRNDAAHVAHDRLENHGRDARTILGECSLQARDVVVAADDRVFGAPAVTPGELGTPSVAAELPAAISRLSTCP